MKKFYTLALAALATLGMSAQVYFVGPFGDQQWKPGEPGATATLNAAGNWEVTLNNVGTFKASTAKGTSLDDWETFNGAAFSISGGNVTKDDLNKFVDTEAWGENTNLPWSGDWTIEITPDYKQMKLTTTTPEPTEALPAYLVGAINSWDAVLPQWKMECTEMYHYTFTCEGETKLPAGIEFKIATSNDKGGIKWEMINYTVGGEVLVMEEADEEPLEALYNNQANMYVGEDFEGTIELVLTNGYNKDGKISFRPKGMDGIEGVTVDANLPAEYFNLQGVRVAEPQNGLYIVRRGNDVKKVLVK